MEKASVLIALPNRSRHVAPKPAQEPRQRLLRQPSLTCRVGRPIILNDASFMLGTDNRLTHSQDVFAAAADFMKRSRKFAPPHADQETRACDNDHQAVRLWLRLLTCTSLIEGEIRNRLRTTFGTTLPRFDLMSQLERHPEGLKMGELSKRMMVTGGNVTGITDQLVDEGLVIRARNRRDRRAFLLKLTPRGRQVFGEMAKAHEPWISELFSALSETDKKRHYGLLAELKAQVLSVTLQAPPSNDLKLAQS